MGFAELVLTVMGCTDAATHYEMPAALYTSLIEQPHEDAQQSAGYMTYGSRLSGHNYWKGMDGIPYLCTLGLNFGSCAVIGLRTEAYPA